MKSPELPSEPVDGFELKWFTLGEYEPSSVIPRRAVYRVNVSWRDAFPDEADRGGIPFIDEWMIYERGRLTGRVSGWRNVLKFSWVNFHASEQEALGHAGNVLRRRIASRREEIDELNVQLESVVAQTTNLRLFRELEALKLVLSKAGDWRATVELAYARVGEALEQRKRSGSG